MSHDDALFRHAFESALDAMLIADDEGAYVDANPAACRLLGVTREVALTMRVSDLVPAAAKPHVAGMWASFLREGEMEGDFDVHRPDGSVRHTEFAARAHVMPGRHLSILRDVTKARRTERALEELRQEAARTGKLAAMGTLVGGVAHEARTPLALITNSVHLARRAMARGDLPAAEAHLGEIVGGVDRINGLVLDLRRFARLEAPARAPASLDEAVRGAVELFRSTQHGAVDVVARLSPTPRVEIDVSGVQQIVLNLLDNAADALPPGGRVVVETMADAEGATLAVSDEGCGIPEEVQERVFDALFTTKPHGTGLGLGIVRRIAEAHGARVALRSAVGKGTRVEVAFPTPRPR